MERLTFDGNYCEIAQCRELPCQNGGSCSQRKVWERLAAYEDTGLMPGEVAELQALLQGCESKKSAEWVRLQELALADKDGRVMVLPCKVGDTVWINGSTRGLYSAKVRTFFCGHPSAVRGTDGDSGIEMIRTTECDIPFRNFGKDVFLTREEAEAKLKEVQKDDERNVLRVREGV